MVAQAELSLTSLLHACSRAKTLTAACGFTVLLTVATGILGLSRASWLRQMLESRINLHVLFALLLCGLVVARCQWQVRHSPRMLPADLRALSRNLSRLVYLLLYIVIGVRQAMCILSSLGHGDAVDFKFFDGAFRQGPDYAGFNPKDDFQLFLASGLLVLIFIRLLVFGLWLRLDPAAAPPAEASGFHSRGQPE
jgi:cytochrome b561